MERAVLILVLSMFDNNNKTVCVFFLYDWLVSLGVVLLLYISMIMIIELGEVFWELR